MKAASPGRYGVTRFLHHAERDDYFAGPDHQSLTTDHCP
jgi:hypothetical protein